MIESKISLIQLQNPLTELEMSLIVYCELESSVVQLESSIIQFKTSLIEVEGSVFELERSLIYKRAL